MSDTSTSGQAPEPVMTETVRALARELRSMRRVMTDMDLAHCASCDNTGIAPEEAFGRDADGAPMVDGVQPCPRGCAVPDWLRLEIQEPSDWLKAVATEPPRDVVQAPDGPDFDETAALIHSTIERVGGHCIDGEGYQLCRHLAHEIRSALAEPSAVKR